MLKLVVLSDLHLRPEGVLSHGLDTHDRLVQGIDWLNRMHSDADLCVLAGDLVDLGEKEAYERLKHQVVRAKVPVEMTIGNHDDRDTFVSVFGDKVLSETGHVDKAIDVKGYRIIILDSAITGEQVLRSVRGNGPALACTLPYAKRDELQAQQSLHGPGFNPVTNRKNTGTARKQTLCVHCHTKWENAMNLRRPRIRMDLPSTF